MASDDLRQDGYVRIPVSALPSIDLRHLVSAVDTSIAAMDGATEPTVTGYTEWVGTWNEATLTVGWDWAILHGAVVLINPSEIRSNVALVSPDLHPVPSELGRAHMLAWIESTPWREAVLSAISLPRLGRGWSADR